MTTASRTSPGLAGLTSLAALLLGSACAQARGMDEMDAATTAPTAQSARPAQPDLATARDLLKQARWPAARIELEALASRHPGVAEVHNLLGYALRKSGSLEQAFAAYRTALRIDPAHLGAHEYIGEAYLMAGRPDLAREHLETLRGLCGADCDAYRDLAEAIGRHGR